MTEIRIPVPRLPEGMIGNLVGLAGAIAIAVAIGGLTGNWWWALLVGGAMAVGMAYVAGASKAPAVVESAEPVRPHLAAAARSA